MFSLTWKITEVENEVAKYRHVIFQYRVSLH